jgi:hypothetical protein
MPKKSNHQINKFAKIFLFLLLIVAVLLAISFYVTRQQLIAKQELEVEGISLIDFLKLPPDELLLQGIISSDGVSLAKKLELSKILPLDEVQTPRIIIGKFQSWEPSSEADVDRVFLNEVRKIRAIPLITWEPWNSMNEETSNQAYQPAYQLKKITDGDYDDYIRRYAIALKKFEYPVFLRFAHEMNGNWYPWGGSVNNNSPEDYIYAWQHLHSIFTQENATNVIWLWTPNEPFFDDSGHDTSQFSSYYPGDEFVDWVGFSAYNWGDYQQFSVDRSFLELISPSYEILQTYNKPIMLAETNSVGVGVEKETWIEDMRQTLKNFPLIQGIVWYESIKGPFSVHAELFIP